MRRLAHADWLQRTDGTLDCFLPYGISCILEPQREDGVVVWHCVVPVAGFCDRYGDDQTSFEAAAHVALRQARIAMNQIARKQRGVA